MENRDYSILEVGNLIGDDQSDKIYFVFCSVEMFGQDKSELEKKWMHNLGYLSLLFSDEGLRQNYEGTYNTINYLLNSIYRELNRSDGKISSVSQLFTEIVEKEELVREKLSDVEEYLWDVRSEVVDSRSSIGNHGLTMNRNKIKKRISPQQSALVETIAFGCSLEELDKVVIMKVLKD